MLRRRFAAVCFAGLLAVCLPVQGRAAGGSTGACESENGMLRITTPRDGASVDRITLVRGTIKGAKQGWKLLLFVTPDNDREYPQGKAMIERSGSWTRRCYFGDQDTPSGYNFILTAVLEDAEGQQLDRVEIQVKRK
jgi:hypothetical protein